MNGSQYLTINNSGLSFFRFKPTFIQFNGLIELIKTLISRFCGGFPEENCVVPGNRNDGY
jgi:hypothetical protein